MDIALGDKWMALLQVAQFLIGLPSFANLPPLQVDFEFSSLPNFTLFMDHFPSLGSRVDYHLSFYSHYYFTHFSEEKKTEVISNFVNALNLKTI